MLCIKSTIYLTGQANHNDRNSKFETYDIEESKQIEKDLVHQYCKKQNSLGHWYLEFEICLEFGA